MKKFAPISTKTAYTLSTVFLLSLGVNAFQSASAQVNSKPVISDDGSFHIDQNAFDIFSGDLHNESNIPLPDGPVTNPQERVAQPVIDHQLAPNSINIQVDKDNLLNDQLQPQLQQQLQQQVTDYSLQNVDVQPASLQFQTRFDVQQSVGHHGYGEGIEVNVYDSEGTLRSSQKVFVRGGNVQEFNGQPLPQADFIEVTYGLEDRVELRVLNLRPDGEGGATEHESAIYPDVNGGFAVEDLQNGGDLDFNDGEYLEIPSGLGETQVVSQGQRVVDNVEPIEVETALPPNVRVATNVVTFVEDGTLQTIEVDEDRDYGEVETPTTDSDLLPHATGVSTPDGEQLIYNQYSDAARIRLGTDGATVTGQFAPLNENPAAAPTLLTGTATVDPFADDNEAGLTVSVGVTQFLHSTHADATDMLGNPIVNPDPDGPRLVRPTGLINNTRIVGYVPDSPGETIPGEQLSSIAGIFDLPQDRAVIIASSDPALVGRGDSAYTDNVGGLIIEWNDGRAEFIPQWNRTGFVERSLTLEAGQARQVIYALVAQQEGQALQLDQAYALSASNDGYFIADGGFRVISALHHPENFTLEMAEVYAVEDTLPGRNAATEEFNGIRGLYAETVGGELVSTVDNDNPSAADARVGNQLATEDVELPGEEGQMGYHSTTVAGGLYVRGSLTLGLGNQRDVITRTTSTFNTPVETITEQTTIDTFHTPQSLVETFSGDTVMRVTETLQQTGTAAFDVSSTGLLNNLNVNLGAPETVGEEIELISVEPQLLGSEILIGDEFLFNSAVQNDVTEIHGESTLVDRQVEIDTDTYPNFSPLLGEIALGSILNFGNTPWTPAANTLRGELFGRGVVLGQGSDSDIGLRAELIFNPFGEEQRPAYSYDSEGNLVALYKTEPLLDESGEAQYQTLEDANGEIIEVAVNQFVYDENGDRIQETVGTGQALGPGIFLRLEEILTDDDGPTVAGGLQFTF